MITQNEIKKLIKYDPLTGYVIFLSTNERKVTKTKKEYNLIYLLGKTYIEHRIIWVYMTGSHPRGQIDHINGIRDDNRFKNLRDVTNQENHRNKTLLSNNKSGVTGVAWSQLRNTFRSSITVDLKHVHLGYFNNLLDACCSRKSSELKYGFHENHGRGKKYKAIT
jgi:hypothetical protein